MKAIFMTEIGGRLMEIDRREVEENPVYYCAVRNPISAVALGHDEIAQPIIAKREKWVAQSRPIDLKHGFAVFLLDSIE